MDTLIAVQSLDISSENFEIVYERFQTVLDQLEKDVVVVGSKCTSCEWYAE